MRISIPLPLDEVRNRLTALSAEWRDSNRHPALTGSNFLSCVVSGGPQVYFLRFSPQGRNPHLRWRASLHELPEGTTLVEASWHIAPYFWAILAAMLALVLFLLAGPPSPTGNWPFAIGFGLFTLAFLAAVAGWRASQQEATLRDLLLSLPPAHAMAVT